MMKTYADKGLSDKDFLRMKLLLTCLPSVIPIVEAAARKVKSDPHNSNEVTVMCAKEWSKLVRSLGTISPACALIHPSVTTTNLIQQMSHNDVTKDATLMATLQKEIPLIHTLIHSLSHYPRQLLSPLLTDLLIRSNAPFLEPRHPQTTTPNSSGELAYFPSLPRLRERQNYRADKLAKTSICTKRTSKHPSLLPGVFTLFCEHGKSCDIINHW